MPFKYPGGSAFNPVKNIQTNRTDFSNRGMVLEEEINQSNEYYLARGIAVIHKKPTPIQIVNVDYPKRSAAKIKEAYFKKSSTTDYNGVYKGYYIDFDAKETQSKTSFPLKNFHEHQINHLQQCLNQGGICFAIIKFTSDNSVYLYKASDLILNWQAQFNGGKKSIAKSDIQSKGYLIKYGINPLIPYLSVVDSLINNLGGNNGKR